MNLSQLIEAQGLSVDDALLWRHQDRRFVRGMDTFRLWDRYPDDFRRYVAHQKAGAFSVGKLALHFVLSDHGTLFVGATWLRSVETVPRPQLWFMVHPENVPNDLFELEKEPLLAEYSGRLVVEWGAGTRKWDQRGDRQAHRKQILAILPKRAEAQWPGFDRLLIDDVSHATSLPPSWQAALGSVGGVYLLVCAATGSQYVGSAIGEGGILGRWLTYGDGHGGNRMLRERLRRIVDTGSPPPLRASVLETFGSTVSVEEAIAREGLWKERLGSRAHGLNAN